MYKLVAIDVDGTLVNDDKKLTNRTIDSIKKALKREIKIVISSARSFGKIKDYLKELNLLQENQYSVTFNGSVVVENKSEQILFSNEFSNEEINDLIEVSRLLGTNIFLYTMHNALAENIPIVIQNCKSFRNTKIEKVNFDNINFKDNYIYKILFVDDCEKILKIRNLLPQNISEKYEITSSIPECIEFVKKGNTKSNAIRFICDRCNISNQEVIAIGDGNNDLQMISFAGLGVAMANSQDELKVKADYITNSNNDDGVANVIERYILNVNR